MILLTLPRVFEERKLLGKFLPQLSYILHFQINRIFGRVSQLQLS